MRKSSLQHEKKYLLTWEDNIRDLFSATNLPTVPKKVLNTLFFFLFLSNQVKNDYSQESPGTEQLSPISGHSGGHSSSSSGLASLSVSVNIDLVYLVINWLCSVFVLFVSFLFSMLVLSVNLDFLFFFVVFSRRSTHTPEIY